MQRPKYENIILYLDITGKTLKKKDIIKSIVNFINEKKNKNPNTVFGVLLINSDGVPDFLGNQSNPEPLIQKIEDEWKQRETNESVLENGLFFALSQIAGKAQAQQADHRIIVISDFPSNKSEDYHDALFELISNVRFLPTYIDVIRVGKQRFYADDVKLRVITTTASGGLFYADDAKALTSILEALTKSKRLADLNQPEGKIYIDEENRGFYENLASDLISLDPGETGNCVICKRAEIEGYDEEFCGLYKCYNCNSLFHEAHAAEYSFGNNIGLPNIFRCPNCDILIKLNYEHVLKINGIELSTDEQDPDLQPIDAPELEIKEEEQAMEFQYGTSTDLDLKPIPSSDSTLETNTQKKAVPLSPSGFNFFAAPVINNDDCENHLEHQRIEESASEEVWQPEDSNEKLTPAERRKRKRNKTITLCPVCGAAVNFGCTQCNNCGSNVK